MNNKLGDIIFIRANEGNWDKELIKILIIDNNRVSGNVVGCMGSLASFSINWISDEPVTKKDIRKQKEKYANIRKEVLKYIKEQEKENENINNFNC